MITQYRPIGLCSTIYKIIIKIIIHRIKPLITKIISPTQSSFQQNRRAADNVIIVQEIISHFKHKTGKTGLMLLKLDLEKAFDSIEWSFVRQALHYFNFPPELIKLIMS